MNLEFPRYVFKDRGDQLRHGGTYSVELVDDQYQYDAALKKGWFSTLDATILPPANLETEAVKAIEKALPTRAELEQKATELRIKFQPGISDKMLHAKIDAALLA